MALDSLDLLKRSEVGAPLTALQHDQNLTAIESAFNALRAASTWPPGEWFPPFPTSCRPAAPTGATTSTTPTPASWRRGPWSWNTTSGWSAAS